MLFISGFICGLFASAVLCVFWVIYETGRDLTEEDQRKFDDSCRD